MAAFPKSVVYFSILTVLMMHGKTNGRRFNQLDKKSVEALCPTNQTVNLYLSGYGVRSAIKLNAMHDLKPIDSTNCTIIIHTRNTGVILNVDSSYNVDHLYGQCTEYIEVLDEVGKNSTNICGFQQSSFVSVGNIKFRYQIKYAVMPRSGFTILATAYRKDSKACEEFMCHTGECIWHGFVCDGIANCPDGSDEHAADPLCFDLPEFTLRPFDINWHIVLPTTKSILEYRKSFNVTIVAAVGCAVFILLFGVLRFVWPHHSFRRRRRTPLRQTIRRISVIHARPPYQAQFGPPPPPYTSLVNEGQSNNFSHTPPSYASASNAASESNICMSSVDEHVKQNCLTEPPPPYEP